MLGGGGRGGVIGVFDPCKETGCHSDSDRVGEGVMNGGRGQRKGGRHVEVG